MQNAHLDNQVGDLELPVKDSNLDRLGQNQVSYH